jgi:hypothetical protein
VEEGMPLGVRVPYGSRRIPVAAWVKRSGGA